MRDKIKRSIDAYASDGVPLGDFLTAVMEHDLFEAFARADEENARDLREIVRYVHWSVPSTCHGSRERVRAWIGKHSDARNAKHGYEFEGRMWIADGEPRIPEEGDVCVLFDGEVFRADANWTGACQVLAPKLDARTAATVAREILADGDQEHGVTPDEREGLGVEGK